MKHTDIIQKLNLEQKCALLSGRDQLDIRNKPTGLPYFYAVYPVGLFAIIDS